MTRIGWRTAAVLAAAMGLALGACTSGDDDDDVGTSPPPADDGDSSGDGELGTGVTEDSIKVAFAYPDIEAVAASTGLDLYHGPYDEIMQALVDDLNDGGGIEGRTLEVVMSPYNPSGGNASSLAACAKMTEDDQVFAVLGGLRGDANLCVVEQHETILVGGDQSAAFLERARAPWVTPEAAVEHSVQALVQALDEEGELEGRTIGVYGLAQDQAAVDAASEALADAGAEVAFEAVNDGDPADRTAIDAQDTTLLQRMQDEDVDALLLAGQNVPTGVLDNLGYYPRLWIGRRTTMEVFANQTFAKFPDVFTVGAPPEEIQFELEPYQECVTIYEEASGEEVLSPTEAEEQEKDTPVTALTAACVSLQIFRAAVEAAGDTLNQDTFLEGVESLGDIELATGASSFGPDKYDAPKEYYSFGYNPDYGGLGSGTTAVRLRSDEPFELEA